MHNQDLSREQTECTQSHMREPEGPESCSHFPLLGAGYTRGKGRQGEATKRDGSGWAQCHVQEALPMGNREPLRGINKGIYILSGEDGSGRNEEKGALADDACSDPHESYRGPN